MSSLVSDEEEDHHTKSLEVPENSSLEEYIQVQVGEAGDDFSPPLIGTKMLHVFQISLLHVQVCYQKCTTETIGVDSNMMFFLSDMGSSTLALVLKIMV